MKILITGATGFLGNALAQRLLTDGETVTALGRNRTKGAKLQAAGIDFVQADLRDAAAVQRVCRGQAMVFHCAALSAPWGRYADFYAANVNGTENVVRGCLEAGVARLIHVSTPSIYFNYRDRFNVSEADALPRRFVNAYAETKFRAEQVVLQGHQAGLPAIILRPRAIFGPGDTALVPRLLLALQQGRLRCIGSGNNLIDLTYIDNVVAALRLCRDVPARALGRPYNLSNGEPVPVWPLIARLGAQLGYPLPPGRIPFPVAYGLAWLMELTAKATRATQEPLLTRYSVGVLAKSVTLDISAAQKLLGYIPCASLEEGVKQFVAWWKTTHRSS